MPVTELFRSNRSLTVAVLISKLNHTRKQAAAQTALLWILLGVSTASLLPAAQVHVRLFVGQSSPESVPFYVRLLPASPAAAIDHLQPGSNTVRVVGQNTWTAHAGAGGVASVSFDLEYSPELATSPSPIHVMWADLIDHSDPGTASRLSRDVTDSVNPGAVKVLLGEEGPRGFTFTASQLLREKALWIPAYDVFITLQNEPVSFSEYQKALVPLKHERILERVADEPEASYEEYVSKWADMGSPTYMHPHQAPPGHVICLSWDSAIPKFGIDRGAGVWNDYGNPDRFRFWFGFGDLTQGIINTWKSQRLEDGLPVVTTVFEDDGIRYEVEQFAYPLNGPPAERKGDIPMVLMQRVRLINLSDRRRVVPVSMTHRRLLPIQTGSAIESISLNNGTALRERAKKHVLLVVQGNDRAPDWHETNDYENEDKRVSRSSRIDLTISESLGPHDSREFFVKLPSPLVDAESADVLARLDYADARAKTLQFWSSWLNRGAQFRVPEKAVNDLFRASLWHALRLPRRHADGSIDLPYSNFAYAQTGIPWPGVHCIYVDYMLYELRGYFSVALEELLAQYRLNQDADGHVSGFANWFMYTPALLYASGQYFRLSHDRKGFEQLLPYALKALAWCQNECKRAEARPDLRGLAEGPLNDGTGTGVWALNQAYLYASLEEFGTALEQIDDSHARAALDQAQQLRAAVLKGFEDATASSPLVQLRDGTWEPYVPSDAKTPRRLTDIWYPSDVDTGPLHLVRLKALPPNSDLANFLLNDHEDNLFLKGWGMANEPVYRPQALAYLYRDDAKAAIRAFYSQLACAFSHTVFEPVEHRWMHGQYFGPPSTDGSWFELFRDLLIREMDDETLIIGQATPRKWLEDGKEIEVARAPTHFGTVGFHIKSETASRKINASVDLPPERAPKVLLVRLRHPEEKPIQSVSVNGKSSKDFDAKKEWIRINEPTQGHYEITATY